EPLRDVQHAVAAGDDHLGVGRVARAERRPCHLDQDDLDREDGRLLLLVRLEPDLLEPPLHAGVGEAAYLARHRHALLQPTHLAPVAGSPAHPTPPARPTPPHPPRLAPPPRPPRPAPPPP